MAKAQFAILLKAGSRWRDEIGLYTEFLTLSEPFAIERQMMIKLFHRAASRKRANQR